MTNILLIKRFVAKLVVLTATGVPWYAMNAAGQTVPLAGTWNNSSCANCHSHTLNTHGAIRSTPPGGTYDYSKILGMSLLNSSTAIADNEIAQKMKSWCDAGNEGDGMTMCNNFYKSFITGLSESDAKNIYYHLRAAREGIVAPANAVSSFPETAIGSEASEVRTVEISNYRDSEFDFGYLFSTNGADFSVTGDSNCLLGAGPNMFKVAAAKGPDTPSKCVLTIKFKPLTGPIGDRAGDFQLTLTGNSNYAPVNTTRTIHLPASAKLPLKVFPLALSFEAPLIGKPTTLTNLGTVPLTLLAPEFTSGASYYQLATLSTPGNCAVGAPPILPNGSCNLEIDFRSSVAGSSPSLDGTMEIKYKIDNIDTIMSATLQLLDSTLASTTQAFIVWSPPSPVAFADTVVGSTSTATITVFNRGKGALIFSSPPKIGGTNAADFSATSNCATPLTADAPPGSSTSCTVVVTFQPTQTGARTALVQIDSNASNQPSVQIVLNGNRAVAPPQLNVEPKDSLAFGTQTVGGLYPSRTVTLKNTGTGPVSLTAVALEGVGFTNVSIGACPTTLVAGASCSLDIAFTPIAMETDYAGTVRVSSNAADSPRIVQLTGRGTASAVPILTWSNAETKVEFAPVSVGTISVTKSLTLLNQGHGGVILTVLNAIGANASAFSLAGGTCVTGTPLFEGNSCRVDIRFAPGSAGEKTAVVQVASTGSFPATLTLTGTGLGSPNAALNLSSVALSFDVTRVNAQSLPQELTLSATDAVNVTGLQISGPYVLQSKTCPTAPFLLAAGSSCTLAVTFQPQAEGSAAGMLRVTTDATPAVSEIALNGSGKAKANVSSGGCSMASGDTLADPTLGTLVLLAIAALVYRRRARAAHRRLP